MSAYSDDFRPTAAPQTLTVIPNPPRALRSVNLGRFLLYSFALAVLTIVVLLALKLLRVPVGTMIDWATALVGFWWLLAIVTIPWNICFQARETVAEAAVSRERGVPLNERQITYVRRVASYSLIAAIALHVASALAFFVLAVTGVSPIGYVGFALALLLTAVRPSVRGYEYLWARLAAIRGQILYPREDVLELRRRVADLESHVRRLSEHTDEMHPDSWASHKAQAIRDLRDKLRALDSAFELSSERNEKEHQRLSRETEQAVAQLAADSQFLDHVREIIRFVKTA